VKKGGRGQKEAERFKSNHSALLNRGESNLATLAKKMLCHQDKVGYMKGGQLEAEEDEPFST
jgi:hypothetical protein